MKRTILKIGEYFVKLRRTKNGVNFLSHAVVLAAARIATDYYILIHVLGGGSFDASLSSSYSSANESWETNDFSVARVLGLGALQLLTAFGSC